jgi:uncharacterized protein YdeI (YjbR/CyaY-like superfamily)
MTGTDPRVDAYIARAQPFAKPILEHVRTLVHTAVPGVQETMKWSFLKTPPDTLAAIRKNKKAHATFERFSPSARREYVEWVTEAKTAATRGRRLDTAVQWMAEGKGRHWKYE